MKAAPISKDVKVPQSTDVIIVKRPSTKPAKKLRGFLIQPAKALTLEEIDLGLAAHLRAKHGQRKMK